MGDFGCGATGTVGPVVGVDVAVVGTVGYRMEIASAVREVGIWWGSVVNRAHPFPVVIVIIA